jgi:inorganic triphosphatase YgiF
MEAMVQVRGFSKLASAAAAFQRKKESKTAMQSITPILKAFCKYVVQKEGSKDIMKQTLPELFHTMSTCMASTKSLVPLLGALVKTTGCGANNAIENRQICFTECDNALDVIYQVMISNSQHAGLMEDCCQWILHVSYEPEELHGNTDIVEWLLTCLKIHSENPSIQEYGAAAIYHLTVWNSDEIVWHIHELSEKIDQSGFDLFVSNLKNFRHNPEVLRHCIKVLTNVVNASLNKSCYDDLLRSALPLIIKAMMKHPNYEELQESGCYFLSYLAERSTLFLSRILEHKGMVAVSEAYRLYKDSESDVITGAKHFFAACLNIELP